MFTCDSLLIIFRTHFDIYQIPTYGYTMFPKLFSYTCNLYQTCTVLGNVMAETSFRWTCPLPIHSIWSTYWHDGCISVCIHTFGNLFPLLYCGRVTSFHLCVYLVRTLVFMSFWSPLVDRKNKITKHLASVAIYHLQYNMIQSANRWEHYGRLGRRICYIKTCLLFSQWTTSEHTDSQRFI